MKFEKLTKDLNNFFNKADNKFNVNKGGCGIAASILAKELLDRNIKFSLKYDNPTMLGKTPEIAREWDFDIKLLSTHYASFSHVWISIENVDINKDSSTPEGILNRKSDINTLINNIYEGLSSDSVLWNPEYDRTNDIKINKNIKKIFNKFDKDKMNYSN